MHFASQKTITAIAAQGAAWWSKVHLVYRLASHFTKIPKVTAPTMGRLSSQSASGGLLSHDFLHRW